MSINDLFDQIPRTHLFRYHGNFPAYRTCGIAGYYLAVIVVIAAGLITRRSLGLLLVLSLVAAVSFYVYLYVRRWIVGRECIVLLEHVWFSLLFLAGTLWALRQPVLPYLDTIIPALAVFLAVGRAGCTLVGCCHGVPSTIGIIYPAHFSGYGFTARFAGIRLFPVAAIEMAGLIAIATSSFAALPFAIPGTVLAWFLISYGFLRFALEGIRGDDRPHWLGLSQPRWMSLVQSTAAVVWLEGISSPFVPAVMIGAVILGVLLWCRFDPMRRLLAPDHLSELRKFVSRDLSWRAQPRESSGKVRIVASQTDLAGRIHISLSGTGSLISVCRLAAAAFPQLEIASAKMTSAGVLHFIVDHGKAPETGSLYLDIVRRLQQGERVHGKTPLTESLPQSWHSQASEGSNGSS